MKIKRIALVLALVLIASLLLVACIPNNPDDDDTPKSNKLTIQLRVNGDNDVGTAWTDIITEFEDETGIEVTAYMDPQVNTQMANRWKGDNPPDMVWIDGNGLADADLVKTGKFQDLTEWFQTAKVYGEEMLIKDVINTDIIEDFNGKMYEIPVMSLTYGLYYDANFFQTNDLTVPTNYEEFLAVSQKATTLTVNKKSVAGLTYPGKYAAYLLWSLIMPAYAAYDDAEFFQKVCSAKDPTVYDDPRFAEVLARFKDYCDKGNLLVGSVTADHTGSQSDWANRRALFIGNGMWLESEVNKALDSNFKAAFITSPLVSSTQTQVSLIGPKNMAVASASKNKENAYKFLSWLYKKENQQKLAENYNYFTALKDTDYSEYDVTDLTKQTYKYVMNGSTKVVYKNQNWGTVGDVFNNVINDLANGKITVAEGVATIKAAAEKNNK